MSKRLLIAGYPKSGNTWFGYMVSYILGAKYIDLHHPNEKTTVNKDVLLHIEGDLPHKTEFTELCKTHDIFTFHDSKIDMATFDKVLVIIRDPRDVAVSYF